MLPLVQVAGRRLRRRMAAYRSALTLVLASGAVPLMTGCGDDTVGPAGSTTARPVRVAFTTSVSQSSAGGLILLRVSAFYQRAGGVVPLGTQILALSDASTQQLPLTLDIGACLQDASRSGSGGDNGCVVQLTIEMVVDGKVVDVQHVSPFAVKGGTQTTLSQPVALQEIVQVVVSAPAANVVAAGQPARLELPGSLTLAATLLDGAQQPVLGRELTWRSDNPAVATVSPSGVVTAVSAGVAKFTATVGDRSGEISVRVVPPPNALVVTASGTSGNGIIRSEPAGILCTVSGATASGTCRADFPADGRVTLTASPTGASQFRVWGGACGANPQRTCVLEMNQARTVTSSFVDQRAFSLEGVGTGQGTLVVPEYGLACEYNAGVASGSCVATVEKDARITVSVSAAPLTRFAGWRGDCATATGNSCTVTVADNRRAVAEFIGPVRLSVAGNGTGSGVVRANAGGIQCTVAGGGASGACAGLIAEGATVTFTAEALPLHRFAGWSGACAGSTGTSCRVTATAAATVVARFIAPARLDVSGLGTGRGRVRSDVGDIDCVITAGAVTGACSTLVLDGTSVTLTAAPIAPDLHEGFSGDCTSSATVCRLTVSDVRTVRAAFVRPPVATVTVQAPATTFILGTTLQASAELRDAGGTVLTGRTITWRSSDSTVMRVSASGLLTPLRAGSAVVTATSEGKSGTLAVTVLPRPVLSNMTPAVIDAVFADLPAVVQGNYLRTGMLIGSGALLSVQNVQLVDSTQFTARLLITGGQPAVNSNIAVTTNGGTSNALVVPVHPPGTAPVDIGVAYGGGGGSAYRIDCAPGTVATALNVRYGTVIDQLQLVCQPVTGTGRLFGTANFSGTAGGFGGTPTTLSCPGGSVATGLTGYIGAGGAGFNDYIAVVCRSISGFTEYTTAGVGSVFPGALFFKSECPVGMVLTGVQGRAGDNIDRSQIRCR